MSESFADLFEESLKTIEMAPGSIVTGTVVDIGSEWVTVHAGLKSEGVIPRSQFLERERQIDPTVNRRVGNGVIVMPRHAIENAGDPHSD